MRGEADERELDQPLSPKKERAFDQLSITRAALSRASCFEESPTSTVLALVDNAVHHRSRGRFSLRPAEAGKARVDQAYGSQGDGMAMGPRGTPDWFRWMTRKEKKKKEQNLSPPSLHEEGGVS